MAWTKDEIYDVWRPGVSPWTPWAKPVLFSFLGDAELRASLDTSQVRQWNVPFDQTTALVVDLPGAEGIWAGVALAKAGYRPIPVYNACPFPTYTPDHISPFYVNVERPKVATAVDVASILYAISTAAAALRGCALADNAPPAFLIDEDRKGHGRPDYGWFDNRSFLTKSDFPSADALMQRGIRHVVLVGTDSHLDHDLQSVLLGWQGAGIQISCQGAWLDWHPEPKRIRPPWVLRRVWERLVLLLGYPDRENGAFGEWVRASGS